MRLHKLTVRAFGPFAGQESVDFDALADAGLFLLHGPTGAGKTSVLDAVCFALYGGVPGDRPTNRLRSDHAAPGTPTEVELELTLSGRRLRIIRNPEYQRPKLRGQGLTVERARTLLAEWDEAGRRWAERSTSHQEVGEEVQRLLGMSRDQFCQVVMLPQGAFARFLQAGATDRAALLGRLFGTERFRAAEDWLDECRRAAEKRCAEVRGGVDEAVHRLREAGGALPIASAPAGAPVAPEDERAGGRTAEPVAAEPPVPLDPLAWSAQLREEARERRACAEIRHGLAARAQEAAAAAEHTARERHDRRLRWARAHEEAERLAAGAAAEAADAARLAAARRAELVRPLLRLAEQADGAALRARSAERAARERLAELGVDPDRWAVRGQAGAQEQAPAAVVEALRAEAAREREALGRLGALREAEQRVAELAPRARRLRADADAAELAAEQADRRLADYPAAAERAEAGREAARGAALRAEQLAERERDQRAHATAAREHAELAQRRSAAERAEHVAREEYLTARQHWLDLRERRLAGVAAELAEQLAAGEPCPVCGAVEHPSPAEPGPERVTAAEEKAAHAAQQRAEEALRAAEERLAALRTAAAEAAARAGEGGAEEWERRAAETSAARVAAARAAADGERWERELARITARRAEDEAERTSAAARAASYLAELELVEEEQERLRNRLAAALTDDPAFARAGGPDGGGAAGTARADAGHGQGAAAAGAGTGGPIPSGAACTADAGAGGPAEAGAARGRGSGAAAAGAGGGPVIAGAGFRTDVAPGHGPGTASVLGSGPGSAAATGPGGDAPHRPGAGPAAGAASRAVPSPATAPDATARVAGAAFVPGPASAPEAPRPGAIAALAARIERRAVALEAAADAVRATAEAAEASARAWAEAREQAHAAGFADLADAESALLDPAELRSLEQNLTGRQALRREVEARLADPELAAAAAEPPADPHAAEQALRRAERRAREAYAALEEARRRCAAVDRLGGELRAALTRLRPLEEDLAVVRSLAELARGTAAENRLRMPLETYVLAGRLEQVAQAASVRLERMSGGRYTLAHSDERTSGRGRSGLGLVVLDAWTGLSRDTATLSGGESFFASLALALGLADVVTDEAGGRPLDTLFIDEGFGTLDEDTLDDVLGVLDQLRERDRTVGIVSHVPELRRRIPAQLRVRKGREGSRISLRLAAEA